MKQPNKCQKGGICVTENFSVHSDQLTQLQKIGKIHQEVDCTKDPGDFLTEMSPFFDFPEQNVSRFGFKCLE